MDIFFNEKQTFVVNQSIGDVRDNIQGITSLKWYKLSPYNISGTRKSDGSYSFSHQFSFVAFQWFEHSPAYLNVKLIEHDYRTKIQLRIRPNSALVIFFYLFCVLFLMEVFGVTMIKGGFKAMNLFLYFFFAFLFFGIIKYYTTSIRRKFFKIIA